MAHRERLSALGNMAATVAHEIRTLSMRVSMGLQASQRGVLPNSDERSTPLYRADAWRGTTVKLSCGRVPFVSPPAGPSSAGRSDR